jgi:phosphohistidine phosphatase SixA
MGFYTSRHGEALMAYSIRRENLREKGKRKSSRVAEALEDSCLKLDLFNRRE